jgi:hypothetical protein
MNVPEPRLASAQNKYVYFRNRSRKICPSCMRRLEEKAAFALCEFIQARAQWVDLIIFCANCYDKVILPKVQRDARSAQYRVVYVHIQGKNLPEWLAYRR